MYALDKLRSILLAPKIDGVKATFGLLKHVIDERDLSFGAIFGITSYVPKNRVKDIQPITCKAQQPFNICCFASVTGMVEIDEGKELSMRSIVTYARSKGLLTGNGYSSLRNAQESVRQFGIAEATVLPEGPRDWESYSWSGLITAPIQSNAAIHKSERYFTVTSKDEYLKALDDNKTIQVGLDWYTGYQNQFYAPYILKLRSGVKIGGHAVYIRGYDLEKGLFKFQNSFGPGYGDNGCFYVRIDEWMRLGSIGYVRIDKVDNASLVRAYEGKDVKSAFDPKIYRIDNGMKRWYPNEQIYFKNGGRFGTDRTWVLVAQSIIDAAPNGQNMT